MLEGLSSEDKRSRRCRAWQGLSSEDHRQAIKKVACSGMFSAGVEHWKDCQDYQARISDQETANCGRCRALGGPAGLSSEDKQSRRCLFRQVFGRCRALEGLSSEDHSKRSRSCLFRQVFAGVENWKDWQDCQARTVANHNHRTRKALRMLGRTASARSASWLRWKNLKNERVFALLAGMNLVA